MQAWLAVTHTSVDLWRARAYYDGLTMRTPTQIDQAARTHQLHSSRTLYLWLPVTLVETDTVTSPSPAPMVGMRVVPGVLFGLFCAIKGE